MQCENSDSNEYLQSNVHIYNAIGLSLFIQQSEYP
jgi:hypothetical protein